MIERITPALSPGATQAPLGIDPARGPLATGQTEQAGADFAAVLGGLATDAASAVRNAESLSISGIRGKASVQQVVEAVMSAEQTLQSAIAIRDKVVSAYLEISRMSI